MRLSLPRIFGLGIIVGQLDPVPGRQIVEALARRRRSFRASELLTFVAAGSQMGDEVRQHPTDLPGQIVQTVIVRHSEVALI